MPSLSNKARPTERRGTCGYQLWRNGKMTSCGKPGAVWACRGGASMALCREHGEFFADAKGITLTPIEEILCGEE